MPSPVDPNLVTNTSHQQQSPTLSYQRSHVASPAHLPKYAASTTNRSITLIRRKESSSAHTTGNDSAYVPQASSRSANNNNLQYTASSSDAGAVGPTVISAGVSDDEADAASEASGEELPGRILTGSIPGPAARSTGSRSPSTHSPGVRPRATAEQAGLFDTFAGSGLLLTPEAAGRAEREPSVPSPVGPLSMTRPVTATPATLHDIRRGMSSHQVAYAFSSTNSSLRSSVSARPTQPTPARSRSPPVGHGGSTLSSPSLPGQTGHYDAASPVLGRPPRPPSRGGIRTPTKSHVFE